MSSRYPTLCHFDVMQDATTSNYDGFACNVQPAQIAPAGEAFRHFRYNRRTETQSGAEFPWFGTARNKNSFLLLIWRMSELQDNDFTYTFLQI